MFICRSTWLTVTLLFLIDKKIEVLVLSNVEDDKINSMVQYWRLSDLLMVHGWNPSPGTFLCLKQRCQAFVSKLIISILFIFFISGFILFVKKGTHREHQLKLKELFCVVFLNETRLCQRTIKSSWTKRRSSATQGSVFVFVFLNETRLYQRTFKNLWTKRRSSATQRSDLCFFVYFPKVLLVVRGCLGHKPVYFMHGNLTVPTSVHGQVNRQNLSKCLMSISSRFILKTYE